MTMDFYWYGLFDKDNFKKFLDFKNDKNSSITIFIDSGGGSICIMESMIYLVNQEPEKFKVVVMGGVYSAAFVFLLSVKCERVILDSSKGMFHLSSYDVKIDSL